MKSAKFLIASFCLMVFIMVAEASATNYYVAKSGNDANPGTEASPWLTIQKAANTAKAGDTVYVKAGTYVEEVNFPNSGTAGNYITFRNYGTDVVTLKPPVKTYHLIVDVHPYHHPATFEILGKSYIKIKGFRFVGYGIKSDYPFAVISAEVAAHHITIDGNRFENVDSECIFCGGYYASNGYGAGKGNYGASDLTFVNNYVTFINDVNAKRSGSYWGYHELVSFDSVNRPNVSYNTFEQTIGINIDFKDDTNNGIISNNRVIGAHNFAPANAWTGYQGQAVYVDAYVQGVENNKVFNNFFDGAISGVGSECGGLAKDIYFYNNVAINSWTSFLVPVWTSCKTAGAVSTYQNIQFINNVAWNSITVSGNQGKWFRSQASGSDIIFRNNIAGGTGTNALRSGVTQDHNSWNLSITDPKFVNAAGNDFHLQSSSPAIDKGTSVGAPNFDFAGKARPVGAGFDLGAYEYCTGSACTSSNPNPTPTCTDGIKNQGETGVDCGGPCAACSVNPPASSITLKPGWNQISSPIAAGIDIATIEKNCTILPYKTYKLWAWNAQTQTWINPTKVEPLKGYWIYATYQCNVSLSGTQATFTSLPLSIGWNKISAQGTFSAIRGTCATHITGNWAWNWDKATERWVHPATMQLDKGYWIKVGQNCVLGG